MKYIITFFIAISITGISYSQKQDFKKYVESFNKFKRQDLLDFQKIIQVNNPMTKQEALMFVYNGDSSKIVCVSQNYNMITEEKGSLMKSIRLPSKCLFVDMGEYFLLANSSDECNDLQKPQQSFLTLIIISKKYVITDKIQVYKSSEDFTEINGVLNTNNGNVFLVGFLNGKNKISASIYSVDKSKLKFVILKDSSSINWDYSNLYRTIKRLGWEQYFTITK